MNIYKNKEAGIGVFAIILIIAIIGIGGYATIRAVERAELDVELSEEEAISESGEAILDLKDKVSSTLSGIKADLEANVSVEASLKKLQDLQDEIEQLSKKVHSSFKAEVEALEDTVAEISAEIEAGATNVGDTIENAIDDISASIDADIDAMIGNEDSENESPDQGNSDNDPSTTYEVEEGANSDSSTTYEVESGSEVDAEADDSGASVEVDSEVNIGN